MKTERKRAILIIALTFIAGFVIGALTIGLLSRTTPPDPRGWRHEGKDVYADRLLEAAAADSAQAVKLKPVFLQAMEKIDSLQEITNQQVRSVVDSLDKKLEVVLSADQMENLREYKRKQRERYERKR
ncbi:MAG: hypothetical protein MUE95_02640 [Cyclobacteriaceae bacterium]|jgi:hypothetical protein|nr:hypothetical protein [Cyclobacteriaceae bacterium]